MRMSNALMIVVAFVCAASAAWMTRTWLIRQSVRAPSVSEAVVAPSRSIMVAARDLKYGEKLTADAIKSLGWPGETMPKGAFTSVEALLGGSDSRTVLVAIAQGEPVLDQKLLGGNASSALSGKLSENMKAVTIRVNDVAGVAGLVQPDDRVDVFLTYGGQIGNEGAPKGTSSVVVLLQNIRILAVDQVTQRKEQPTPPAKAVTLEATTEEAQKLVLAGRVGELSLALNRIAENTGPQETGTIAFDDLMAAERTGDRKAAPGGPVVTVTRAAERKDYQVLPDKGKDESWQTELLSHQGSRSAPR